MSTETTYICDKCGAKFGKKPGNLFELTVRVGESGQYGNTVMLTNWGEERCADCIEKLGVKLIKLPDQETVISREQPEETSEERLIDIFREFIQEEAGRVMEYS